MGSLQHSKCSLGEVPCRKEQLRRTIVVAEVEVQQTDSWGSHRMELLHQTIAAELEDCYHTELPFHRETVAAAAAEVATVQRRTAEPGHILPRSLQVHTAAQVVAHCMPVVWALQQQAAHRPTVAQMKRRAEKFGLVSALGH